MPITPPDYSKTAGIPSQWHDEISATAEGFIMGDVPAIVTEDMTFAVNQNIPARTPVALDGSGDLVIAAAGTPAVGFTVIDVVTGAAPKRGVPVYRSGVFNPALANWPASYNTDELKLEAFRGAPTPTTIVMRPVRTMSVAQP